MLRILAILLLAFLLLPVTFWQGIAPAPNISQTVELTPLPLSIESTDSQQVGQLEFRGAWRMESENSAFGGISSMLLLSKHRFLMLSDGGTMIGFTFDETESEATGAFIAPLPSGPPKPNKHAIKNWDAESMVYDANTRRIWVGYEQVQAVWRYAPSFAGAEIWRRPKAMRKWPDNGGPEAMLRLEDGRFIVFAEAAKNGEGRTDALIFDGDPAATGTKSARFAYRPPKGFAITDATLLPDGRALLLHRRFRPSEGVRAVLSIGDPRDIRSDKVWEGQEIARLEAPMLVDNMEAIAVSEENGETIVWLASDDNFNQLQQTILMKFALLSPGTDSAGEASGQSEKNNADSAQQKAGPARPGFENLY